MRKERIFIFLEIFFVILIIGTLFAAYFTKEQIANEAEKYSYTSKTYKTNESQGLNQPNIPKVTIRADYDNLKSINSDVVGWLYIPHIGIDYPLLQTDNNEIYMNHDWEKNKNIGGSAFVDAREDMNMADNYIIYGHSLNRNSKIMFSPLLQYKDSNFLKQHPYIYMSLSPNVINKTQNVNEAKQPDGEYCFEIFSICEINTNNNETIAQYYQSELDDISQYYNMLKENSIYPIESPGTPYKIITLSTCSKPGTDNNNAKLLVCGALYQETINQGGYTE